MNDAALMKRYRGRHEVLKRRRVTWDDHWRDLSKNVKPRRRRFDERDFNEGTKRNTAIINNTATRALNIQTAGLMGGITSPARPWYKLVPPDPALMNSGDVRFWLSDTERRQHELLAQTNFYNAMPLVYSDLGLYGVAAMFIEEDPLGDLVRFHVFPIGSYCLALNHQNRVDTIYRDTILTVGQLEARFGLEACSTSVKNAHKDGLLDREIAVVHLVQPNQERDLKRGDFAGMEFESVWYEQNNAEEKFLGKGGFNEFPVVCPRWSPDAEEVYSDSPGMVALGDIRALQHLEKRAAVALDKIVDPPMVAPDSLKAEPKSIVTGEVTYLTGAGTQKFEPAHTIDARVLAIENAIARHELRINRAFSADIFLMAANTDTPNMTATEINERHEEKMLQLGPTFGSIQNEGLDPIITRLTAIMFRAGLLLEPPKEMQGLVLQVEHISILAQAQKLLGAVGLERSAAMMQTLAGTHQDVIDKYDADYHVEVYHTMMGADPMVIRSDDQVAEIRAQRAQQMQAQQAAEMAAAAKDTATAAKTAGEVEGEGLQNVLRSMGVA